MIALALSLFPLAAEPAEAVGIKPGIGEVPGITFNPACRCGTTPLTLSVDVSIQGFNPIQVTYTWGDGDVDQVTTQFFSSSFTHTYSGAGNLTFVLSIRDASDIVRSFPYGVFVYAIGYGGTDNINGFMEGFPSLDNLTFEVGTPRNFQAIAQNIGDKASAVEIEHRAALAPASCFTVAVANFTDLRIGLLPNLYAVFQIPISSGSPVGTVFNECVSFFTPSAASPTVNVTVFYQSTIVSSPVLPEIAGSVTPAIRQVPLGVLTTFTLTLTNTGERLLELRPRADVTFTTQTTAIRATPIDIAEYGTFNGTFQYVGTRQSTRIMAGEVLNIDVSVKSDQEGTFRISWLITPRVLHPEPPPPGQPIFGDFERIEAFITITPGVGAVVVTVAVNLRSQTSAEFVGQVTNLGPATFIDTSFQFKKTNETTFTRVPPGLIGVRVTSPGVVVRQNVILDADSEYQVEFVGTTNLGQGTFGGIIVFNTTAGPVGQLQTDFGGVLQVIADFSGFSAEVVGYIIGTIVLVGTFLMFARFGVPNVGFLIIALALTIIFTIILLWHPVLIVVIGVVAGVLVWDQIRGSATL